MPLFRTPAVLVAFVCVTGSAWAEEGTSIMEGYGSSFGPASYYAGAAAADELPAAAPASRGTIADEWCDCCNGPLWSVQAGAVILARTSRSTTLLENVVTGGTLADIRDLGTPWGSGPDVSVRRWLDSGSSLNIRFFSVDNWNSRSTFTTPPIVELPTIPPLFALGVTGITATYATRLYSTELNWQRPTSDWFAWLLGFRWVELYEDLNLNSSFVGNSADIRFQTANRLYGGQAGANVSLFSRGAARIDSVLKAGLFGNAASQQFRVTQTIGPLFSAADRSGQVAFLGEIGVVGVYQWTDHIALRGGYQVLWLDGIALAPDQIAATRVLAGNGIDTAGDSFYHGALMGIEVAW